MHIGIGGNAATLKAIVDEAAAADVAGLAAYSVSNVFSHDAIGTLTVAATQTTRIELLTAVVPALPRHPLSLAQQALTAQAAELVEQSRCSRVFGHTSRTAAQKPRAPSPTATTGGAHPHRIGVLPIRVPSVRTLATNLNPCSRYESVIYYGIRTARRRSSPSHEAQGDDCLRQRGRSAAYRRSTRAG